MKLESGQRIHISSALNRQEFDATVYEHADDVLALAIACDVLPFTKGNVIRMEVNGYSAMGVVNRADDIRPYFMVRLTGFCWLGKKPRAARHPKCLRVAVDYLTANGLKRTMGETTDLSKSGVRIRVRNSIGIGTVAHLVMRVGTEGVVECLARVRRIVSGSEGRGGGYDVAFSFERFLEGQALFYRLIGEDEPAPPIHIEEAPAEQGDWFAAPTAA
jgi:hypothetical protein